MAQTQRGFQAYDGNHAPNGPFVLNKDSPQAHGLVCWWPLHGDMYDYSGHRNHGAPSSGISGRFINLATLGYGWDQVGPDKKIINTTFSKAMGDFTCSIWFIDREGEANFESICGTNNSTGFIINRQSTNADTWGAFIRNTQIYFTLNDGDLNHIVVRRQGTDGFIAGNGGDVTNTATVSATALSTDIFKIGEGPTGNFMDNCTVGHVCIWDYAVPDGLISHMFNPATRWDLYHELGRVAYSFAPAASAAPIINLVMAPYVPA